MYAELAKLRQRMNAVPHVEPTGAETFPDGTFPDALGSEPGR